MGCASWKRTWPRERNRGTTACLLRKIHQRRKKVENEITEITGEFMKGRRDILQSSSKIYKKYPIVLQQLPSPSYEIADIDYYRTFAICCIARYRMPQTRVLFFQNADGVAPAWEWLKNLRKINPKAYAKCAVRIRRLAEMGHEWRRPEADLLRDGIYELRARLGTVNYRGSLLFSWPERDRAGACDNQGRRNSGD
jgi:hypothetical protein